jgi:hypothetical protein
VLAVVAAILAAAAAVVAVITLADAAMTDESANTAQALGVWLAEPAYKCALILGVAGALDWLARRTA